MKKILIIGAIALVVFGCILAAGCTSTTVIPSADDQIIGTWMNNNGTTKFVINENMTGAYYKLDNGEWKEDTSILWSKNKDGTYYLINGNAKATVTLDPIKGIFTTDSGSTFTKQSSENSGSLLYKHNLDENAKKTRIVLDANANLGYVTKSLNGVGYIKEGTNYMTAGNNGSYIKPEYYSSDPTRSFTLTGFYTEPTGGDIVFNRDGTIANENLSPYTSNGVWVYDGEKLTLYAHWVGDVKLDEGFKGAYARW